MCSIIHGLISNWEAYIASNELLHSSAVDGELLRHDHYWGEAYRLVNVPRDLVGVYLEGHDHAGVRDWYRSSLTSAAANEFNHGVVAGAFWSVVGPGRNLQVTADAVGHYFHRTPEGDMVMFDENAYPGRFPEPITLGAWVSVSDVSGRVDGAVLSCYESENAVGYQLLFGSDPYRVMDYRVVSDTNLPPMDVIREFPSEETWWTVRVRDQYGSTIYADPIRLDLAGLPLLSVENARTGKTYGLIGHAILDAEAGDTILVGPATYDENIEFSGKTLTVRSLDPNDPVVVAGTIIRGQDSTPTVTFSGPESGACTLSGLTIQSGTVGISCRDAVPTIRNCVVQRPDGIAIEFWIGCEPKLVDCTVLGRVREGGDPGLIAYWTFDETAGGVASDNGGEHDANVVGNPLWQPEGGKVGGALELSGVGNYVATGLVRDPSAGPFSVFVWVKGGAPGQVILSQEKGANWLMASSPDGALMTDLKSAGRQAKALTSTTVVTDGNWHRVGLSWDGSNRILYVDDVEVARDTQASLAGTGTGLYFGAGSKLATDAFWKGLIDDVRIYNRAVAP